MISTSSRVDNIGVSASISITSKAIAMREKGIDVISLSVGEPDVSMPKAVTEEAIRALNKGLTKYTQVDGITELKVQIQKKLDLENGLKYDLNEIIVGSGAKQIIFNAIMAFVNPGDEVIIPAPYWVSYPEMVRFAQGEPKVIEGSEENNFKIKPKDLEKAISKKTKAIFLNSPSNPTGSVYTKEELIQIGNVLKDKQLLIISDEIYEKIIYDSEKHYSIASLCPFLKDNTLVVNGLSKAYSMTGMRIGYGAALKEVINPLKKIQSHSTSNANSIAQYASVAAFESCEEFHENLAKLFNERRDFMFNRLEEIGGFNVKKPKGAFYFFPNIEYYLNNGFKSDIDFCDFLLEKAQVAIVPGSAFGSSLNVRFSYATDIKVLEKALNRIEKAVKTI